MNSHPHPGSLEDQRSAQQALRRVYELGGDNYNADALASILNAKAGLDWTERDVRCFIYRLSLKQGYHPTLSVPFEKHAEIYKHCRALERLIDLEIKKGHLIPQPISIEIEEIDGQQRLSDIMRKRVLNLCRNDFLYANGQGKRDFSFASMTVRINEAIGTELKELSFRDFVQGKANELPSRQILRDSEAIKLYELAGKFAKEANQNHLYGQKSLKIADKAEVAVQGITVEYAEARYD